MLNTKPINKILFIDIETVPQVETFEKMTPVAQKLFKERFKTDLKNLEVDGKVSPEALEELYNIKASLHVEWAKIVCLSVGAINTADEVYKIKTKSLTGATDFEILTQMMELAPIKDYKGKAEDFAFCAHNGKVFDFPFITKRMILNRMEIPKFLQIYNMKPWEITHLIDTKEMWKFGVFDNNSSLSLLAHVFGTPSSKDDMDGSMVKDCYYKEKNVAKIAEYCEKDVLALAHVYLKMNGIENQLTKI